jgi:hypothetical protein
MKGRYLLLGLALVFLAACGGPQATKTAGGAVFDISPEILGVKADTLINLGAMRSGEIVRYDARIRNAGVEPLVIKGISLSCGCTTIDYEKKPIAPGAEGQLSFRFDSRGMWGTQFKLVEIDTSASPHRFQVMLQAEIAEAEN